MQTKANNNESNNVNNFNVKCNFEESDRAFLSKSNEVAKLAQTLPQALKAFGGLDNKTLSDGATVDSWFRSCGIVREADANGRKPTLKIKHIRNAWAKELQVQGEKGLELSIYKEHKGRVVVEGQRYEAYALMPNNKYVPIKKYLPTAIDEYGWNVKTIVRGLSQSKLIDKHLEKAYNMDQRIAMAVGFYYAIPIKDVEGNVIDRDFYRCQYSDIVF